MSVAWHVYKYRPIERQSGLVLPVQGLRGERQPNEPAKDQPFVNMASGEPQAELEHKFRNLHTFRSTCNEATY